jgi:hypothetical protein
VARENYITRSFIIYTPPDIYYDNKIKVNDMGTNGGGGMRNAYLILVGEI